MIGTDYKIFKNIPVEEIVTLNPLQTMPLGVAWTMPAAIIVGVGMVLALLAYLKGYFSDDPYPGYGRIYRYVLRSRERTREYKMKLREKIVTARREFTKASVNIKSQAGDSVTRWSKAINSMEKIVEDYKILLNEMNINFGSVCRTYKAGYAAINRETANTLELPEDLFGRADLNTDEVFRDVSHHFLDDTSRKAKEEEYRERLKQTFEEIETEYRNDLEKLDVDFRRLAQQYAPEDAPEANHEQA
jgi:hypothetical protein